MKYFIVYQRYKFMGRKLELHNDFETVKTNNMRLKYTFIYSVCVFVTLRRSIAAADAATQSRSFHLQITSS